MPELIDPFGRKIEYLRLSVTDRCDFRCFYCIPKGFKDFVAPDSWLTQDETVRLVRLFSELGVGKVRITGGEPLVRKDLLQMLAQIGALPAIEDLSLSTNASRLADYAEQLKAAGVSRINVSLDSLNKARFHEITKGNLDDVIAGLMAAKAAGLNPIKINMVVMKGLNDGEIGDMVNFCLEHAFTLRFIETMPVGDAGRDAADYYLNLERVKEQLAERFELEPAKVKGAGPASYVRVKGSDLRIGFITPMSQHFCGTCNRVRLSVEGTLYLCLGQDDRVELRPLMRQGLGDEELKQVLCDAINRKPRQHEFSSGSGRVVRVMSVTGG